MNEQVVKFNLDDEAMSDLINLCASERMSPSEIIQNLIREKAAECGLSSAIDSVA